MIWYLYILCSSVCDSVPSRDRYVMCPKLVTSRATDSLMSVTFATSGRTGGREIGGRRSSPPACPAHGREPCLSGVKRNLSCLGMRGACVRALALCATGVQTGTLASSCMVVKVDQLARNVSGAVPRCCGSGSPGRSALLLYQWRSALESVTSPRHLHKVTAALYICMRSSSALYMCADEPHSRGDIDLPPRVVRPLLVSLLPSDRTHLNLDVEAVSPRRVIHLTGRHTHPA